MKRCIKCLENKPLTEFSGSVYRKDGHVDKCKVCTREYSKQNRIKNGWVRKVRKSKEERLIHKRNEYRKYLYNLRKSDPVFKLKSATRSLLYNSFKRACNGTYKKSISTESMLGCSMDFFIEYIRSKFKEGMTLENHGMWHFDHINPIGNCRSEKEILEYNHYTNFQPLWARENILKSNKCFIGSLLLTCSLNRLLTFQRQDIAPEVHPPAKTTLI